ncbi:MAG: hypothetical protein DHS80DRAFT_23889 [Piptocephalis tieghemiana]|nr:MAG: hypothetical protein DHS80DRAFT_23889 [Piptocephalis tieghemiana]
MARFFSAILLGLVVLAISMLVSGSPIAPAYTITFPNAGAILSAGAAYPVTWFSKLSTSGSDATSEAIDLTLFRIIGPGKVNEGKKLAESVQLSSHQVSVTLPTNLEDGEYTIRSAPAGERSKSDKAVWSPIFQVQLSKGGEKGTTDVKEWGWENSNYWGQDLWW